MRSPVPRGSRRLLPDTDPGDHYPKEQVKAAEAVFRGETLWIRGVSLRGDPERGNVEVGWRRPVADYLAL